LVPSWPPFCWVAPAVSGPPDGADGFAIGVLPPPLWPAAPPPWPCDSATVEPAASAMAATEISNVRFMSSLLGEIRPLPSWAQRAPHTRVPRAFEIVPIWGISNGEGPVAKLASVVDTQGKEFRANAAAMRALVSDLEAKRAEASLGGPPRARERHAARGKLLPRERVTRLIDPGAPFLELSPLAANGLYDDAIHGAGIITGIGRVEGRECVIVCNDATIKGGTYYPMTVKKHLRAQEIARE